MTDSPYRSHYLEGFSDSERPTNNNMLHQDEVTFLNETTVESTPTTIAEVAVVEEVPAKKSRLIVEEEAATAQQSSTMEEEIIDSEEAEEEEEEDASAAIPDPAPTRTTTTTRRLMMGHKAYYLHPTNGVAVGPDRVAFKTATQITNGTLVTSPLPMFELPSIQDMRAYQMLCLEAFMSRYEDFVDKITNE